MPSIRLAASAPSTRRTDPPADRVAAEKGFTLVELLIALAIASLLAALVVPSWRSQLAAAELRERSEALCAAMARARSEAIKRGTRFDLCPTADRAACTPAGESEAGLLADPN